MLRMNETAETRLLSLSSGVYLCVRACMNHLNLKFDHACDECVYVCLYVCMYVCMYDLKYECVCV